MFFLIVIPRREKKNDTFLIGQNDTFLIGQVTKKKPYPTLVIFQLKKYEQQCF